MKKILVGKPYVGVLQALVIGNEDAISQSDWQLFLHTGTNHLMSISGLHITMLSSLIFALSYFVWRKSYRLTLRLPARKAAVLFGLITASIYALIAGFSVPTQRTFYMLCVFAIGLWCGRGIRMMQILAYALFTVVLLDPWAVMSPGFWLSFGAVAFMGFTLGSRLGQSSWLISGIRSQYVVTLALIPFLLLFFQQFSLVSPIANAFAIPMVSLLVVPLSIFGAIFSIDALLLLAHSIMAVTMDLLGVMADFDWAIWQQFSPPVWAIALSFIGLLCLFFPKGFPLRFLGIIFSIPLVFNPPKDPLSSEMRLIVLDVGQGLSVLVQTQHHALLYDTGTKVSSQNDSGARVIVPYLRSIGLDQLDGIVVSHNDIDHSGGLNSVLKEVPSSWILSSLPEPVNGASNLSCYKGQSWQWDGVNFEVLSPTLNSYNFDDIKDNNRSCVIKVTSPFGSVLLAGDIEREVENNLVSLNDGSLKSDVLIVPHHGSKTSSSNGFIDAVAPQVAIFTMGYRNRFGHPKSEVLERYKARNIQTYRSDKDGAVLVKFASDNRFHILAWRHEASHYWYD